MGSGFYEIEDLLEAVRATVVRVGNFGNSRVGCEFQQQADALTGLRRSTMVENAQVLTVHGEDQIEVFKIAGFDDSGA